MQVAVRSSDLESGYVVANKVETIVHETRRDRQLGPLNKHQHSYSGSNVGHTLGLEKR